MSRLTYWTKTLSENKWILIALLFFVLWKFFLIHTLWGERNIPPVPDDSYIYALHIDSSLRCENLISCNDKMFSFDTYAGLDHLTYRVLLGSFGKLFRIDALAAYHLGFYIGTVFLAIILSFFLHSLHRGNKPRIAFSLFILALYSGSGSYHGFYWVVPSFFVLMFFFLILGILLREDTPHWKTALCIIVPLTLYTHTLGLYLLLILPLFLLFYSISTRRLHPLLSRKILFIGCIAIIAYAPAALYFSHTSYGNPYGPETLIKKIINQDPQTDTPAVIAPLAYPRAPVFYAGQISSLFPSFKKIQENYFAWIFPNPAGYILSIICIGTLLYRKKYTTLSLYFAGLAFSLLSTIDINGERSLLFLWPMTFLLYGEAAWESLQITAEKITAPHRMACQILISIVFLAAVLLSASYSYFWNAYLNRARNIDIPDALADYILQHNRSGETVSYSKDIIFVDYKFMLDMKDRKPRRVSQQDIDSAKFYITSTDTDEKSDIASCETTLGILLRTLGKTCTPRHNMLNNEETEQTTTFDTTHQKEKRVFGDMEIYIRRDL